MPTSASLRVFIAALLLGLAALFAVSPGKAQQPTQVNPTAQSVKEKELLKELQRIQGRGTLPDTRTRVLEQPEGRAWRQFHQVTLRWIGAVAILGMLGLIVLFYLIRGSVRIEGGPSQARLVRFNAFERFVHWLTAVSFIVLGITGLNVTFGKLLLMPLIGPDAFSAFSEAAKYAHNFTSFPFMLGIVLILVIWIKDNIPDRTDIEWFRQGGGFIASKHAPARRFNAGEKMVFWGVLGAGAAVSLSGLLLLFPFYVTNIAGMQIVQVVHSVIAILFVALILGHIYVGTLGMEGAFEAMWTGEVDFNWAKEHHDLWLEDQLAEGRSASPPEHPSATPAE